MKILIKKMVILFCGFFALFIAPFSTAMCSETFVPPNIVFLLDTSNSMNAADENRLAVDGIRQLIGSFPSYYRVGIVAYGSGVQISEGLTDDRNAIDNALSQVSYQGYTNAGAGLEQAAAMFGAAGDAPKAIVLITDGEIQLADDKATQVSGEKFSAALAGLEKNSITLYTISLRGKDAPPSSAVSQDLLKRGKVYEIAAEELTETVNQMAFQEFGVRKIAVGIGDTDSGSLKIMLPGLPLDRAKILLTSRKPLTNITADYQAADGRMIGGRDFSIIEIERPSSDQVTVHFTASVGDQVQAVLIPEAAAVLEAEAAPLDGVDGGFTVKLKPVVSAGGERLPLLGSEAYENKTMRVLVAGVPYTAVIHQGVASFEITPSGTAPLRLEADFTPLGLNVAAAPVILELKPRSMALPIIGGLLLIVAAAVAFRFFRKKPLPAPIVPSSRYDFAGKLNFYVTKTPDDSDIAPQIYNLYRLFSQKEITLAEILAACGIKTVFPGADKIIFRPGANKALVLINRSDCTVLKNRELVIKEQNCLVYFEEKVTVSFEDEISELVFHYKNVKPSEKK